MGNFSGTSFPTDRWEDSDTGNTLDQAIASIDEAIRHVLGVSTNTLTAPFAITEAGAVTAQVSFAIGTSADIDDILATIPASPGSSEDTELATVEAIRKYVVAGAGDVLASSIETVTDDFDGILSSADDTVQKALDTIDDHAHAAYLPLAGGTMSGAAVMTNGVFVKGGLTGTRNLIGSAAFSDNVTVGDSNVDMLLVGSPARPRYNGADVAMFGDIAAAVGDYLELAGGTMEGEIVYRNGADDTDISAMSVITDVLTLGDSGFDTELFGGYVRTVGAIFEIADSGGDAEHAFDGTNGSASLALNGGDLSLGEGGGDVMIGAPTTEPADGSLNVNQIAFWYDSTGPSLKVKHKDGSSTVRSNTVCALV